MPPKQKTQAPQPSPQDWGALFDQAKALYQLAPWKWLDDSELFALQMPQEDLVYCSVLGAGGEHFGLNFYLGEEGLQGLIYLKQETQLSEIMGTDVDIEDLVREQNLLQVSFEDRQFLSKEELQRIKDLGVKFRGRKAWPHFESYLPGYAPWPLERDEVLRLTQLIQQALEVLRQTIHDPGLLEPGAEQILVRKQVEAAWVHEALELPEPSRPAFKPEINELALQRAKQVGHPVGVWLVDLVQLPLLAQEGPRPHYPWMIAAFDEAGTCLYARLLGPKQLPSEVPAFVLQLIETAQQTPARIETASQTGLDLLEPVAEALRIDFQVTEDHSVAQEFFLGLLEHMQAGFGP